MVGKKCISLIVEKNQNYTKTHVLPSPSPNLLITIPKEIGEPIQQIIGLSLYCFMYVCIYIYIYRYIYIKKNNYHLFLFLLSLRSITTTLILSPLPFPKANFVRRAAAAPTGVSSVIPFERCGR